jgi:O-antigen ligase
MGTILQLLALVWLLWNVLRTEPDVRAAVGGYLAGCTVDVALTWRAYLAGDGYRGTARYTAEGFDPNDMASTVAIGIPMAVYLATSGRGWMRFAALLYIPLAGSAIALSASRGGLLAMGTAILFVVILARGRARLASLAVLGLMAAGVVAAWSFIPPESLERLATVEEQLTRGTLGDRVQLWRAGVRAFLRSPFLGYGAGGFPSAANPLTNNLEVAHSTLLTVAVELGAVGLVLFGAIFVAVLLGSRRGRPAERAFAMALTATWLVATSSLAWNVNKATWFVIAVGAALGALPGRDEGAGSGGVPRS